MKNRKPHQIITRNDRQTECLGECIGRLVSKGLVIRLSGELGAGKTRFVQGLARGLDVPEAYDITSPTYTLINEYPARIPLFHVDLYRIGSAMDADGIGLWDLFTQKAVVAVEWADRLDDGNWPENSLNLVFRVQEDDTRIISLIGGGLQIADLIQKVASIFSQECVHTL
jgi:tRNA threonylcarbamoyladenosine biosynthesis protein TsaE